VADASGIATVTEWTCDRRRQSEAALDLPKRDQATVG
jgi:hypothetical protein